jgi:hypothetical protein
VTVAERSDKTLVNFRLPRGLLEEMDAAARAAGLNRTEWVISTLTIACRDGMRAAALAVAAGATGVTIDGCPHPKHRRAWRAPGLVCEVCLTVLERTRQGA